MIENENIKEKLNMINMKNTRRIIKIAETRMAVHTHTHTHTCLLVNNFASKLANIKKNIESLVEDRTVLWNSIVLSLSAFISKNGRDGPVYE